MIGYSIHNFLRKALDSARRKNVSCRVTVGLEQIMDIQRMHVNRADSCSILNDLDASDDNFNCGDVNDVEESGVGMRECHQIPLQNIQFVIRTHMYPSPNKIESTSNHFVNHHLRQLMYVNPKKKSSQFMRSAGKNTRALINCNQFFLFVNNSFVSLTLIRHPFSFVC